MTDNKHNGKVHCCSINLCFDIEEFCVSVCVFVHRLFSATHGDVSIDLCIVLHTHIHRSLFNTKQRNTEFKDEREFIS